MKKLLTAVFTLIIIICAASISFASDNDVPDYIRVGIKTANVGVSYNVSSSDGFSVYEYNNGEIYLKQSFDNSEIKIVSTGNWICVFDAAADTSNASNALYTYDNATKYFLGCKNMENGTMSVAGTKYRGGIMLFRSGGSTLRFINVINTEKYLYGVVPREMSSSYPLEALKAQAVAARSFAISNMGKHKSLGYEVCTTDCCQVYGGVDKEVAKCSSAVDDTRGMLVYYNGSPVSCYYSANNGGYIESCKDMWGTEVGYLQAKKDDYTPEYKWTYSVSAEKASSLLKSAGYNVGTINQVKIVSKTSGNSVAQMDFVGSQGTASLKGSKIKSVFGSSNLKTLNFDVTFKGQSVAVPVKTTVPVYEEKIQVKKYVKGQTGISTEKILSGLSVVDGQGNYVVISDNSIHVTGKTTTVVYATKTEYKTASLSASESQDIVFNGRGIGHCIGMSQTGAKVMAESGFGYIDILKYYYIGVTVQ